MAVNRREFNRQETIRHIKAVFLSLYAEGGINAMTVTDLCDACGISKTTFYLYFSDKFAVLESVEKELLEGLQTINPDLADCDMADIQSGRPLPQAYQTVCFLKKNAEKYKALLGPHGDPSFLFKWKRDIEASFMGRFEELKGNTQSADIACTIFSSALVGLYTHFLFDMPDITEEKLSIIMGNLLKYALLDFQAFAE